MGDAILLLLVMSMFVGVCIWALIAPGTTVVDEPTLDVQNHLDD